jgi:hypothetical protein
MVRAIAGRLVMLVAIAGGVGCDTTPPGQPSPLPDPGPGTLSVTSFESVGWHLNGEFHYRPSLRVTAGRDGSAVDVSSVSFEGSGEAGSSGPIGVRYRSGRRVLPGGTLDLLWSSEIVTGFRLDTLRATVEFVDAAGGAGSTVAESAAPTISTDPPDSPDAALAISQFVVAGSFSGGQFWYLPKLTLIETTGRSRATIVKMTFELLDVGPAGRVPPSHELIVVPAGGAMVLDEDPSGFGPWQEISSSVKAARVSVVIHFMDAAGRGGSVTAIAEVS